MQDLQPRFLEVLTPRRSSGQVFEWLSRDVETGVSGTHGFPNSAIIYGEDTYWWRTAGCALLVHHLGGQGPSTLKWHSRHLVDSSRPGVRG